MKVEFPSFFKINNQEFTLQSGGYYQVKTYFRSGLTGKMEYDNHEAKADRVKYSFENNREYQLALKLEQFNEELKCLVLND